MKRNVCCFIGHRNIDETEELRAKLTGTIEKLIVDEGIDTFLFGSKSRFNDLCLEFVTRLKEKYPHIKRIYVRAEYPIIDDKYKSYLLKKYEDTYYPEKLLRAGKAVYVERNCEMIRESALCVVYYNKFEMPSTRKSGTKIAVDHAAKQGKRIINVFI